MSTATTTEPTTGQTSSRRTTTQPNNNPANQLERNAAHLRAAILNTLASAKPQERIDAALVGYLNKAWAVLEKLLYLEAAPRAGVYLNEEGQRVFNGFPDWEDVDEPWPTKPTRPPRRPRS